MRECERLLSFLGYSDLTEPQPESTKTIVEREIPEGLTENQSKFLKDGVLILEDFIPDYLIYNYNTAREKLLPKDRSQRDNYYGGWAYPTPFMNHSELRDLALFPDMNKLLKELIGETMGLNLALTGWVSTQRNWHQDTYLNPKELGSRYVAAWLALGDIEEDSGPFQFIRGSNRWPTLTRDRLFQYLSPQEQSSPDWPNFTQDQIARMCEEEITKRGGVIESFTPKRGTLLLWHSNLMHRGSVPKNPNLLRKSLICHYSSVPRRRLIDMSKYLVHRSGGIYFDLPTDGRVRPE